MVREVETAHLDGLAVHRHEVGRELVFRSSCDNTRNLFAINSYSANGERSGIIKVFKRVYSRLLVIVGALGCIGDHCAGGAFGQLEVGRHHVLHDGAGWQRHGAAGAGDGLEDVGQAACRFCLEVIVGAGLRATLIVTHTRSIWIIGGDTVHVCVNLSSFIVEHTHREH